MQKQAFQPVDSAQPDGRQRLTWASFREQGVNVSAWAQARGFNAHLVYEVLKGERKCLRGQSYAIAKELGMK